MKLKKGIAVLWGAFGVSLLVSLVLLQRSELDLKDSMKEEEVKTLEIYAWSDEAETFRALVEGFNEKYPEIKVNVHYLPNSENVQGLQISLNGEEAVDVIAVGKPADATQMIAKGQIYELHGRLEQSDLEGINYLTEPMQRDGEVYMLPYRNSVWTVYYNKNIFEEMGVPYPSGEWTWEEYAELAVQLTDPEKGRYGSMNFTNSWWRVPARTAGASDPMNKEDLELFAEAAVWNYELTYQKNAAIPYEQLTNAEGEDYIGRFLRGESAMMYCGEWCLPMLHERIEKECPGFSYDVTKLPKWNGEIDYAIGTPAVIMVAEKSVLKDEAVLFVKYASGEEGAERLAARGILPAWNSDNIRNIFRNSMDMPEHTEYFFMEQEVSSLPATAEYSVAINLLQENIWPYLLREITLDTALQNFCNQMEEGIS